MARFTFLEVHLDGAQFTANAPFSAEESNESEEETVEERIQGGQESSGSGSTMGLVAGFVVLVGAVAVLRKLRSRSDADGRERTEQTRFPSP